MKRAVFGVTGTILIVSMAAVLAAKKPLLTSQWRDRELTIDGDSGDWPGPLRPIEENHPTRGGGGGYRRGPGGGGGGHSTGDSGSGDSSHPTSPDQVEPTNRLEVYGPQKDDAHSFVADMAPGITVKTGQADGYLVYELKVPLAKTTAAPYAIETKPGAVIGIGIETPKMEHPSGEGRGGGMGGGMGGMGGGMGGRGGGGMGHGGGGGRSGGEHGQSEQPKPLKNWATIQLASAASTSQRTPSSSK